MSQAYKRLLTRALSAACATLALPFALHAQATTTNPQPPTWPSAACAVVPASVWINPRPFTDHITWHGMMTTGTGSSRVPNDAAEETQAATDTANVLAAITTCANKA